jgi:hypothetical protein
MDNADNGTGSASILATPEYQKVMRKNVAW